jgi:hypothetical protein
MKHGTISTYTNHCCRCPQCTEANRAHYRRRRALAGTAALHGPRLPRHGTRVEYIKHGCRCQLCRTAEATYRAKYRKMNK